jgi:hypothetical protein
MGNMVKQTCHRPGRVLLAGMLALLVSACGGGSDKPAAPDDGLWALPGNNSTRAVRLHPAPGAEHNWCVYRTWPDERVQVFSGCNTAAPLAQSYSRGATGELLVFGVVPHGNLLYLLVYDARRNIPSGRVPGTVRDGVDVVRFDASAPQAEPQVLATELPLGGFDNLIHAAADDGGLTACAARSCLRIVPGQPQQTWTSAALSAYEMVEAAPAADHAFALLRRVDDGYSGAAADASFHYAWARLGASGTQLDRIPRDCLPYALSAAPGAAAPTWQCAQGAAGMASVLQHELQRMPGSGLMDYGSSNSEGRIAWSQAYYLAGLLELGGPAAPRLSAAADWAPLRQRLNNEVQLLARQGTQVPGGYASRRYAMTRSPLTFALHLGRVARVLDVAQRRGISGTDPAREALAQRLWQLDGTVEMLSTVTWRGASHSTLAVTPGADFWCDGANVPYNYVSAYADGLLLLRSTDPAARQRAQTLLQPLLQYETLPTARTWKYWWARGFDGWTADQAVSSNTPTYAGYRSEAHISYRSLDAMAVLRLAAADSSAVPAALVAHLRTLTAEGALLPWVNAELARSGAPVTLSSDAAYRHARSAGPWEIESQVWALERLASP